MWDFNFNPEDQISKEQQEELFTTLVQKALKGEQSEFRFIVCWQDRNIVRDYIRGTTATVQVFDSLITNLTKVYVDQIEKNAQDLGIMLSLKQFYTCKDYYQKEREIAEDMLDEYRSYIFGGHIWDTLVGNTRKEEDMVDYRTLPVKWF